MKITKSRLLQIIREEVELHEKNTFIFEENDLGDVSTEEEADKNRDGKISRKEADQIFKDEQEEDEQAGNLEENDVEEDRLFGPKDSEGQRPIIEPEKNGRDKLEIKIR